MMACRTLLRRVGGIAGVQVSTKCTSNMAKFLSARHVQGQQKTVIGRMGQIRSCTSNTKESPVIVIQDYADFESRVLSSQKPVVVDFHAEWCNPCKLLCPRLESIVSRQNGKVILAKVDVDKIEDLMYRYQVQALPTVIAIRKGQQVDSFVGLQDDDVLETFVEKLVV